jgi:hypothetical protein
MSRDNAIAAAIMVSVSLRQYTKWLTDTGECSQEHTIYQGYDISGPNLEGVDLVCSFKNYLGA